jgi:hypothetical protein
MAGSSGKPLVQKLGTKSGFYIFIEGAPTAYGDIVGPLPADGEGPVDAFRHRIGRPERGRRSDLAVVAPLMGGGAREKYGKS